MKKFICPYWPVRWEYTCPYTPTLSNASLYYPIRCHNCFRRILLNHWHLCLNISFRVKTMQLIDKIKMTWRWSQILKRSTNNPLLRVFLWKQSWFNSLDVKINLKYSNHSYHQWFHRSLCVDQGEIGLFHRNQNITGSNSCGVSRRDLWVTVCK